MFHSQKPHRFAVYGMLFLFLLCFLTSGAETPPQRNYTAIMNEDSTVYDGDTIQDVYIPLKTFSGLASDGDVLWPGVLLKGDTLYIVTDIRLRGIDTPEKRPLTKGRTPESLVAEKAAAARAQQALLSLVKAYNYEFTIVNPALGKYAGRTVADIYFGEINAADYLIQHGHAKAYDGGTKPDWNW